MQIPLLMLRYLLKVMFDYKVLILEATNEEHTSSTENFHKSSTSILMEKVSYEITIKSLLRKV